MPPSAGVCRIKTKQKSLSKAVAAATTMAMTGRRHLSDFPSKVKDKTRKRKKNWNFFPRYFSCFTPHRQRDVTSNQRTSVEKMTGGIWSASRSSLDPVSASLSKIPFFFSIFYFFSNMLMREQVIKVSASYVVWAFLSFEILTAKRENDDQFFLSFFLTISFENVRRTQVLQRRPCCHYYHHYHHHHPTWPAFKAVGCYSRDAARRLNCPRWRHFLFLSMSIEQLTNLRAADCSCFLSFLNCQLTDDSFQSPEPLFPRHHDIPTSIAQENKRERKRETERKWSRK